MLIDYNFSVGLCAVSLSKFDPEVTKRNSAIQTLREAKEIALKDIDDAIERLNKNRIEILNLSTADID